MESGAATEVKTARDGVPFASLLDAILRTHGLPGEFVAVARVESGFNPQALSPKGARGLWQLMPDTARRYGLVVGTNRDDRLDPLKSTHAAATYLQDLYGQFRDWPLALAAYNAGENRVRRVVERSGGGDFWELSRRGALPDETRRYVPAVVSLLKYWTPAESVLPRPLDRKPADESETTLGELHSYGPSGYQPGEGFRARHSGGPRSLRSSLQQARREQGLPIPNSLRGQRGRM